MNTDRSGGDIYAAGRKAGYNAAIQDVMAVLTESIPDSKPSVVIGDSKASSYDPVQNTWAYVLTPGHHSEKTTADLIAAEYDRLKALSLAKNKAYGDSALHPVGIFSHLPASEAIRARIDDKLARHKCAPGALGENEVDDLIGYLVLLNIATRMEAQNV